MGVGGVALRFGQTAIRAIQLCASILVLGVFSYFLAVLKDHHIKIAARWKAVEGIAGAAIVYTIFGVILTLCLGGISFFAFLAIVLDICFVGCFAAVAYYNRGGAHSCSGYVRTPLGDGPSNSKAKGYGSNGFGFGKNENSTYLPNLHLACELETAVFAVAILNCLLFLVSAAMQVMLVRHHKKEKRFGPSPANNYTSGAGRRPFWKRRGNKHVARDAEVGAVGAGAMATEKHHHDNNHNHGVRPSQETGYTGSTVAPGDHTHGTAGGYGYNNTATGPGYATNTNTHTHTHGTASNF